MTRLLLSTLSTVAALALATAATAEAADFPGLGPPGTLAGLAFDHPGDLVLRGPNARAQLVVSGSYSSGQVRDHTQKVAYRLSKAGVVEVDQRGFVQPIADGEVTITATGDGKSATSVCRVESFDVARRINFPNEVVPLLTKLGCNTGGCHGKSGGQNGFKLSLLGFYPNEDYEWLVKEHRGRRVFPAAPEYSLLIRKPLNQLPHGGGRRIDEGSYEHQLLIHWIEQGMPYGQDDDPIVERIEVLPKTRAMNRDAKQQLKVVAYYSDGTTQDVTRLATYESNDTEMAESTRSGVVTAFDRPGEVAVMVRFQGQVSVFRAVIPMGVPVTTVPPARNFIDQHVFGKLRQLGIPPSALCDDSAFVRRVFIDVAGRVPTAAEAQQFVQDKDPGKRDKLIDRLLASPDYADYFANKWVMVLRNQRINKHEQVSVRFHAWVRQSIAQNMPFDQFVRTILTASGDVNSNPVASWYTQVSTTTGQVEDTAQLFLGLRIQCAHCHHHPYEKWDQDDYFAFQAFFTQLKLENVGKDLPNGKITRQDKLATAKNPRTGDDLKPAGLGGEPLELAANQDARQALVDWMAHPENPFFARALANRYWKHFFNRGIVDPEDDMRVTNPPSNPALLDALAKHFTDSKYDTKDLVRTICRSSAYQLSSEPNEYNKIDKQNFSSFYTRRINAEPLYDAVNQVAATAVKFKDMPEGTRAVQLPDNGFNDYFLTVFGIPQAESACECERSEEANLAQSLHLLNSTDIQSKLSAAGGRADQLAKDDQRSDSEKVTELYYWAFARPPRPPETERILAFLDRQTDKKRGYEDVLWALFNTKEFLFNH